ncbi:hypothetical protein Q5752_004115 [Cryptotrichosporon argae]
MSRSKPYDRPAPGNPDLPWKHDLHASSRSLAGRVGTRGGGVRGASSGHVPSLLVRMHTAAGKELLPNRTAPARGFTADSASFSASNAAAVSPNANVELLPPAAPTAAAPPLGDRFAKSQGLVRSAFEGLGTRPEKKERNGGYQRVEQAAPARPGTPGGLSISGASKVRVRVENLAVGTTAEDVVAAFAPLPITSATVTQPSPTVTIELVVPDRATGDALVGAYDGVVADGNTLNLSILTNTPLVRQERSEQQRGERGGRDRRDGRDAADDRRDGGRELLRQPQRGLADRLGGRGSGRATPDRAPRNSPAAAAHASLASRMGSAPSSADRSRGRGQIGGGSYADMLID